MDKREGQVRSASLVPSSLRARVTGGLTGEGGSNLSHVLEVSPQVLSSRLGGCGEEAEGTAACQTTVSGESRFGRALSSANDGRTLLRVGGKGGGSVSDLREEKEQEVMVSSSSKGRVG